MYYTYGEGWYNYKIRIRKFMVYTPSLKNMQTFAHSEITLHEQISGQAIVKYSMNYMREYPFHE